MSGEEVTADTEAPGAKEAREPVIRLLACPVTSESTTLFTAARLDPEATLATEDSALTMLLPASPETLIEPVATEASTFKTEACAMVSVRLTLEVTASITAAALSVAVDDSAALLPPTTAVIALSSDAPAAIERLAELVETLASAASAVDWTAVEMFADALTTASTREAVLDTAAAETMPSADGDATKLPRMPFCAAARSVADRLASWLETAAEAAVALRADTLTGA